jgi:hypothetical protein
MTIISDNQERIRLNKQARAVKRHLESYGSITDNMALYQGIPGFGIIKRLGARIHELRRDEKMNISTHTEHGVTTYTLIREEKETRPTFSGFERYLRKRSIHSFDLSPARRSEHYSDYCADIARRV